MNRNFAHLRFENKALYFNDITDIPLFKETVFFFTEIVKFCKNLDFARTIPKVHKRNLALASF